MPQSLAKNLIHLIFSTKDRQRWLEPVVRPDLHRYMELFHWQAGFGAFSIGQSAVEEVRLYIQEQETHHRTESFQEEFRGFLARYEVEYDERYVWD
jgi:hypothetical protein